MIDFTLYFRALQTSETGHGAGATAVGPCGSLVVNKCPIEAALGQFCKCWGIKKATFYCGSDCSTKRSFTQRLLNTTELEWLDCK